MWKKFGTPNQEKERQESVVFDVKVIKGRRGDILRLSDLQFALVWKNGPLVKLEGEKYTMKRHLEIELPEGMTYLPGSHLQVASFISVSMKTALSSSKKSPVMSEHSSQQTPQSVPSKSFNTMLNLTYQHQIPDKAFHTTDEKDKAALEAAAGGLRRKSSASVVQYWISSPNI